LEIFEMIGLGRTSRDIAVQLHLSVKTIEVHRANIKRKLKLRNSAELVRAAVRWVESKAAY
jgi:DNA-binding CsgD family transcriptional regulator